MADLQPMAGGPPCPKCGRTRWLGAWVNEEYEGLPTARLRCGACGFERTAAWSGTRFWILDDD